MWCLTRCFPLLVQDLVTEEIRPSFEVLLMLLDVMDIVFAPKISLGMVLHLKQLVAEHNYLFETVFNCKIIPKLHFLLHYSGVILKLGPLVHIWCMRYEAKHNYFIRVAEKACNFKNITSRIFPYCPIVEHTFECGPHT